MKRVVPFTKTITFKTMIAEITDITVNHSLELKENNEIEGDILVDGTYKMTDASQIEEEFHYKLPFTIEIDSKYNLDDSEITIGDFYFEIINEEDLKINVEIDIDGIEEKKEETEILEVDNQELIRNNERKELSIPIPVEVEETKTKLELSSEKNPLEKLTEEIEEDIKNEPTYVETNQASVDNLEKPSPDTSSVSSIFSAFAISEETFSTYYVYVVRENDTIDAIIDKYKTTKEEIENYNDLSDIKVGSKLIIPCVSHE